MKKLIAVLTLMLAFTISANAQDRKMSPEESAKMDAYKMSEYLGLTSTQQEDFMRLFIMKHNSMQNPEMTDERKKEMSRIVDMKIRATLTTEQIQKLDSNPELSNMLTGAQPVKSMDKKAEKK